MRLIDADALLSECKLEQKQASYDRQYANAFYSASGDISTEWWCIEDIIEDAPTIEEWKKGKWIEKQLPTGQKYSVCSNCETDIEIKDEHGTFRKLNFSDCKFCPVCGSYNGGKEE